MTATATIESSSPGEDQPTYKIGWHCNTSDSVRLAHCEIAKRAGFAIVKGAGPAVTDKPTLVVGSGFSAIEALPQIKEAYARGEMIVALKGAHDWLIDNGVIPTIAVAIDAQPERATCFKRLDRRVLYFCASQMHPNAWFHLSGQRVLLWHPYIVKGQENMPEWQNECLIMSASTTGNSAILALYVLGRRNFTVVGMDSSIRRVHWWNRWLRPKLKLDGTKVRNGSQLIEVEADGRRYWSTPELIMQAREIELMLPYLSGAKITSLGDGYYQATLAEGKRRGWQI